MVSARLIRFAARAWTEAAAPSPSLARNSIQAAK